MMSFCNECEYVEVHVSLDYGMLTIAIFDVLQEDYESIMTVCESFDWQDKAFQKAVVDADGWLWRRMIGVALADAMADGSRRQVSAMMFVLSCAHIENEMRALEVELDAIMASEYA